MTYFLRAVYYVALLAIIARLLNRRVLQTDKPYYFAVNVTYGTLAGSAILKPDLSLWDGTLPFIALSLFVWLVDLAAARWPALKRLVAGSPIRLVEDGKTVTANLRRLHMTDADLQARLREMKVAAVADVEMAEMETDGRLGLVMRRP